MENWWRACAPAKLICSSVINRSDQDMSDLNTEDLYRPNVVAVCGVRHPLVSRRSLEWNNLYEQPWIFP